MTEWRDIIKEPPPLDGTEIDLFLRYADGTGKRLTDCWWVSRRNTWTGNEYEVLALNEMEEGDRITHWMPKPADPEEKP